MTVTLSAEGRARLDKHLDAVEAALAAAGNSRERRRAVVDDLEAQVQEMLAARSATPTLEDVEAVLAQVDPPAAYREGATVHEQTPQRAAIGASVGNRTMNPSSRRRNFMRSSVVIALIVCGTLLAMTPAIVDHFRAQEFLEYSRVALAQKVPENVNLHFDVSRMSDGWRFMFWLTGSATILLGAIGGFVAFASERRGRR